MLMLLSEAAEYHHSYFNILYSQSLRVKVQTVRNKSITHVLSLYIQQVITHVLSLYIQQVITHVLSLYQVITNLLSLYIPGNYTCIVSIYTR
jgi:hypothetical protein